MASETTTTTDHDEIRSWVEEHEGTPARVRGTENNEGGGVLRIDFPGGDDDDRLEPIEWDLWFEIFEESDLAAVYQEQKADGEDSTFIKLIAR